MTPTSSTTTRSQDRRWRRGGRSHRWSRPTTPRSPTTSAATTGRWRAASRSWPSPTTRPRPPATCPSPVSSTTASTRTATRSAPAATTWCSTDACPPSRACARPSRSPAKRASRSSSPPRSARPGEREYFEAEVKPLLGHDICYAGEVAREAKLALVGGARALLNPIRWDEPFGLCMVEALACGTPVITTPRGAAPEIVDHGITGFLASTTDEAVAAVAWAADARPPRLPRRRRDPLLRPPHGRRPPRPLHHVHGRLIRPAA